MVLAVILALLVTLPATETLAKTSRVHIEKTSTAQMWYQKFSGKLRRFTAVRSQAVRKKKGITRGPTCGDGVTNPELGEECDGGYNCTTNCKRSPPPPCTCTQKVCKPDPNPWDNPHFALCEGSETPWTRVYGGPDHQIANGLAVDSNGTVYLSTTDRIGEVYHFVVRQIDSCGNLVWETSFPQTFGKTFDHLAIDVCGNSYLIANSGQQIVVKKLSFWGEELWSDTYNAGDRPTAAAMAVFPQGIVNAVSNGEDPAGLSDIHVREYDTDGALEYAFVTNYSDHDLTAQAADTDPLFGHLLISGKVAPPDGSASHFFLQKLPQLAIFPNLSDDWMEELSGSRGEGLFVASPGSEVYVAVMDASTEERTLLTYTNWFFLQQAQSTPGRQPFHLSQDSDNHLILVGKSTEETGCSLWVGKFAPGLTPDWESLLLPTSGTCPTFHLFSNVALSPNGFIHAAGTFQDAALEGTNGAEVILRKHSPTGASDAWPGP